MLLNNQWQKVPGCQSVQCFPFVHSPSILCSNSIIFSSSECVVLVDPGGDFSYAEFLMDCIQNIHEKTSKPLFVFFTHCHVDHCMGLRAFKESGFPFELHTCQRTNMILSTGDARHTCAELYGWRPLRIASDNVFFDNPSAGDSYSFPLGHAESMEIFFTPGHTEDSLCFRVGDLLIVGDLPFALTPGVAGLAGWSQTHLIDSLAFITDVLTNNSITDVFTGHGRPFDKVFAERMFHSNISRAKRLKNLSHIDDERVDSLKALSSSLLEEASSAFSAIGGRVLRLTHYLDTLGEVEASRQISELVNLDKLDTLIHDFHSFSVNLNNDENLSGHARLQLLCKAVQFAERGQSLLKPLLAHASGGSRLVRRTQRLLIDFVNMAQGVQFEAQEFATPLLESLNSVVQEALNDNHKCFLYEESLYAAAHDPDIFRNILMTKICEVSLLEELTVVVQSDPIIPGSIIQLEEDVFQDTISSILELYALSRCEQLKIHVGLSDMHIRISFKGSTHPLLTTAKLDFLRLSIARCHGMCRHEQEDADLILEFPHTPALGEEMSSGVGLLRSHP